MSEEKWKHKICSPTFVSLPCRHNTLFCSRQRHMLPKSELETLRCFKVANRLTFCIRSTVDNIRQFGFQARVCHRVSHITLVPPGAQRHDALQGHVRPKTFTLVHGERWGVIQKQASILQNRSQENIVQNSEKWNSILQTWKQSCILNSLKFTHKESSERNKLFKNKKFP